MRKAIVFQNGGSKALRIPKQFNLNSSEVIISQEGERIVITPMPTLSSWQSFAESAPRPSEDFMAERQPLPHTERNWK